MTKSARARAYWNRNKTTILASALIVTTTVAVLEQKGIRSLNQFLKDHDLYEDYYAMEEE